MLKENFDYNNGGSYLTIFPLVFAVSIRTHSVTCNTGLPLNTIACTYTYVTAQVFHGIVHSLKCDAAKKKTETVSLESFEHF